MFFLQATQQDLDKHDMVEISQELRDQAGWWLVALKAAAKHSPIVHPDPRIPSNAVDGFTDAAGGSMAKMGAGLGGLVPPHRYFYLPWPAWLNLGWPNSDGVVFSSKLTCLELFYLCERDRRDICQRYFQPSAGSPACSHLFSCASTGWS